MFRVSMDGGGKLVQRGGGIGEGGGVFENLSFMGSIKFYFPIKNCLNRGFLF